MKQRHDDGACQQTCINAHASFEELAALGTGFMHWHADSATGCRQQVLPANWVRQIGL
jgi:hypothetical protein